MEVRISAVAFLAAACTGSIFSPTSVSGQVGGAPGTSSSNPGASNPGSTDPGASNPSGFNPGLGTTGPTGTGVVPGWVPQRIRRLTGSEYDATVRALLGTTQAPSSTFPTQVRQSNFTRNDAQIVDTVYATALEDAADALAATVTPAACTTTDTACAQQFIETFASAAFRRPLTADDRSGLLAVFQMGSADGFAAGIQLVVTAVLQAPSFLYATELNPMLDPYEIATQLSYLVTGGPPDAPLLADAASGALAASATRIAHARRLLAKGQVQQFVVDWLGLYRIESETKDSTLYPDFTTRVPQMMADARAFIDGKKSDALLGLLSQPAFLSAYSNVSDSGPIHRGAAIIRQVLCHTLADPASVGLVVTPPPPDPTLTTRERFAAHVNNPVCASCHVVIDPAGFAFEGFDAEGNARTTDNGKPVDTTGELDVADLSGPFQGNVDFVAKLAASQDVRSCFSTQLDRFAMARTDPHIEANFAQVVAALPDAARGDPVELLVALAGSDLFVKRSPP
jgi:hypothetical protein